MQRQAILTSSSSGLLDANIGIDRYVVAVRRSLLVTWIIALMLLLASLGEGCDLADLVLAGQRSLCLLYLLGLNLTVFPFGMHMEVACIESFALNGVVSGGLTDMYLLF